MDGRRDKLMDVKVKIQKGKSIVVLWESEEKKDYILVHFGVRFSS